MSEKFPVCIQSIKEYGIEEWFGKSFTWPVPDKDFLLIYNQLVYLFGKSANDFPKLRSLILVLNKPFLADVLMYLHALLVFKRIRKKYSIEHDLGVKYYGFICKRARFNSYFDNYKMKELNFKNSLKFKSKQLYRNFRQRNSSLISLYLPRKDIIGAFENESFHVINPEAFSFIRSKVDYNDTQILNFVVNYTLEIRKFVKSSFDLEIEDNDIGPIQSLLKESMSEALYFINEACRALKSFRAPKLLINSLADMKSRCIAVAAKSLGKTIIGGVHGNCTFLTKETPTVVSDLPLVDEFIMTSDKSASLLKKTYENLPLKFYDFPKMKINKSDYYQKLHDLNKNYKFSGKVKKLLLLEPPLNDYRFAVHRGHFWFNRIQELVKISTFLRSHGYETIIKRHPDTTRVSEGFYEKFFDHQLTEKFEDCWYEADAFIFLSLTTTTFGFACTTDRPIFLLKCMIDDCFAEVVESIESRCSVINSSISEVDRIEIDEIDFRNKLNGQFNIINSEFSEIYLFG